MSEDRKISRVTREGMESIDDAIAFLKGDRSRGTETRFEIPDTVDVRRIRKALGMTQIEFCETFGFRLGTVRNWEQGRASPQHQDRAFLSVIMKEPNAVKRALLAA